MQSLSQNGRPVAISRGHIHGLYAVTPDELDTARLTNMVQAAIAGGASLVQYRNKAAGSSQRRQQAIALLAVCRAHGVPLVVNDDLDVAVDIDADGVHVGADDESIATARARLATGKIIGASCYDQLAGALAAQQAGATYVAFGSFFPSSVKPGAVSAPLGLLHDARTSLRVPVVAIGGITVANAPRLIAAGADSVAVISALFAAPDVGATAREFSQLFSKQR